jgi:hypothetical protein
MFQFNLFFKKLKKQLLSINTLIESFFNNFQKIKVYKILKNKKNYKSYKTTIIGGILIIVLILSYFLTPTIYNKDELKIILKEQVLNKYNIKIKFNDKIKYGLFPKPHFFSKNLSIIDKEDNIANIKHSKLFISYNNLFSLETLKLKNLLIKNAEFKLNKDNVHFFQKVLNANDSENKVIIKNSNLFYTNLSGDVIFLSKIEDINFYYDPKRLENRLSSNYKIFNIPFKIDVKNNKNDEKLIVKINSDKIRLSFKNTLDYSDNKINGLLNLSTINKETSLNYNIDKNSLNFESINNNFNGSLNFKPFYLSSKFYFDQLDPKYLFENNSLFINFIESGIINNKNLNMNIIFKFDKIKNNKFLKNLVLKTYLEEGNFNISNSTVNWKDSVKIKILDTQLNNNEDGINLIGRAIFNFDKSNKFYRSFQINKKFRKNLKEIKLDFFYDLTNKKLYLDNVKVDKESNTNLEKFINNFNKEENTFNNKIIFRSFVNKFFEAYAG